MFTICMFGLLAGLIAAHSSITVGVIIAAIGLVLVLLPIEGYEEKECVSRTELIPLKSDKMITYIMVHSSYYSEVIRVRYAYDNSEEYGLSGVAYQEALVDGNIKIYKSADCNTPVLKCFKTRPNRFLWTFAPFSTKTEYVFYVPEDKPKNVETTTEQDVTVEML